MAASFHFTLPIPARTRISARVQHTGTAAHVRVAGHLYSTGFADFSPLSKVVTYGANTADSGGTPIDPGATAGTKGAWIQMTASTTAPIVKMLMAIGSDINNSRALTSWLFDVGIGSAGNEVPLIQNISLECWWCIHPRVVGPIDVSIPQASRLSIRAQCTNIDATDRLFDIVLYGVS